MRRSSACLIGVVVLLLTTMGCMARAQTTNPTIGDHDVWIRLEKTRNGCEVTEPNKTHAQAHCHFQVEVSPGDTVTWIVQNGCGTDMEIGIGDFRSSHRWVDETPGPYPYPLKEQLDALKIRVAKGKTAKFEGRIRSRGEPGFFTPRNVNGLTWDYDIRTYSQGTFHVIADPEIEIPHPF